MSVYEAMVWLVLQLHWRNIVVLNASEKGSRQLLYLLNENNRTAAVVGYDHIENYPWPVRPDLRPRIEGFLLIYDGKANLSTIILPLQRKHAINRRKPWILGVEGCVYLDSILQVLDEGDKFLVVGKDDATCSQDSHSTDEALGIWMLRSPGDGSLHFEKRQNTTDVAKLFDVPFTNFMGRTLRISSLGSFPIRELPEQNSWMWGGYVFQIINTLSKIFNFTYVVKEADGRLYGMVQEDGRWTGMIGELINKSVDMGAGDLSWTYERFLAVDLTQPIFPETVTFIYRAPDFYSRTWILFQGIETKVWIALLSTTIAVFAVYFLSLSLHQAWMVVQKDPESSCIDTADESISTLYRALLGKGVIQVPFPVSCRTVLGVWIGGSLILSALYGGSLTSRLSLHKSPKPADSLKDLLKRHPDAMLALRNSSQIHQYFKATGSWQKIWQKNMAKHVIPGKHHIEDTMVKVHRSLDDDKPYVWISERSMLVKLMQRYSDNSEVCDLYVAKESIVDSDWSLALQRDSPFLEQFNEMILRMERFGLLERWRREFWESATGSCRPSDGLNPSEETPISLADTRALFIVLAIGWLLGTVVLCIERHVANKKGRITISYYRPHTA